MTTRRAGGAYGAEVTSVRASTEARASTKPALARAELLDKATRTRLAAELDGALKRRPASERRLAGVLRTLSPLSPSLRASMADATDLFLRRGTLDRELYGACIRSLADAGDKTLTPLLRRALVLDSAGGTAALSAACFSRDPSLGPLLAKAAAGQKAHVAFAAETARVARGEANGRHLAALAPMIKESHRLTLCAEVFLPLSRADLGHRRELVNAGAALAVLRGAERHLGRWLVLAEVAAGAGDSAPLDEATALATSGPPTARPAWSLVAWALESRMKRPAATPGVRPTVEIVSRLSDRPSADRDATFLFRMARAGAPAARPMLETLAKVPLATEVALRAATFLARDHGRADLAAGVLDVARSDRKDELRGMAIASLYDTGDRARQDEARRLAGDLLDSRSLVNVAWGVLVRAATSRGFASAAPDEGVVTESALRWMQWGWLE